MFPPRIGSSQTIDWPDAIIWIPTIDPPTLFPERFFQSKGNCQLSWFSMEIPPLFVPQRRNWVRPRSAPRRQASAVFNSAQNPVRCINVPDSGARSASVLRLLEGENDESSANSDGTCVFFRCGFLCGHFGGAKIQHRP